MIYYLHQHQTNHVVLDPEGSKHADVAGAQAEAVDAARELMSQAVRVGRDITDWRITIVDQNDTVLATVPFASVLQREPRRTM